jgi:hypothetical protein
VNLFVLVHKGYATRDLLHNLPNVIWLIPGGERVLVGSNDSAISEWSTVLVVIYILL